eukprot:GHUV01003241.1.p1 GENE.GHUV01003241.1~~GHUV01003241.1.p1  ORF type:complete len:296 (+),score=96.02 GHUV01003241.1:190-1077(+)
MLTASLHSFGPAHGQLVPLYSSRQSHLKPTAAHGLRHTSASMHMLGTPLSTHCIRRSMVAQSDARGAVDTAVQTAPDKLSVSIPTAEARSTLRFELLPNGKGHAVVVSAVAEGSSAQQCGVKRGMKLAAISDPIRRDEMWELQDRPSLRYIRDVMRMRSAAYIELCFDTDQELLAALEASEGSLSITSSSSSSTPSSSIDSISSMASTSESSETVAERLQQQFERAQATTSKQTAFEQRQQRRKEYMSQVGQRNDQTFAAIMASAFLLPALVILLVAYGTGYLDNLYSDSLTNMR